MGKWNVYSKRADEWGHWRRWRALVRTVTFTYRRAAANVKPWKMASCAILSVIYPIYTSSKPLQFRFGTALWSAISFVFSNNIAFCAFSQWFPVRKQDLKYLDLTHRLILLGLNNMRHFFPFKITRTTKTSRSEDIWIIYPVVTEWWDFAALRGPLSCPCSRWEMRHFLGNGPPFWFLRGETHHANLMCAGPTWYTRERRLFPSL